jgi:hypothetical protein
MTSRQSNACNRAESDACKGFVPVVSGVAKLGDEHVTVVHLRASWNAATIATNLIIKVSIAIFLRNFCVRN